MRTMLSRTVYDKVRRRKFKLLITFRAGARTRQLLKHLRLNNAEFGTKSKNAQGKRTIEVWVNPSDAVDLRADSRIESLVVLHDGRDTLPVDNAVMPDPSDETLAWEIRDDLQTAYRALKPEMPVPAEVFNLRLLRGLDWKTVADRVGFTVRHCHNLLERFLKRLKEVFPELVEYLIEIMRRQ